ncbi:DUF6429 family protein [Dictyobacter arantiisoli]|uniref:DUF6429 domain-containing protein n=1 Tax=Dictyobacter arantiisoli TaxID=2014874 RepID=A0A5A5TK23_9CHLR|nr:DUF6429 family protein [Dictyobacter arantiisoli]GCF11970.1 hypothetical protein KDI_55340 [Dictyobacter arantiisoli]
MNQYNQGKIDEVVLALMQLTLHDTNRAWKGFDWDVLDRLYEKGWIDSPRNKTKSIGLTEEGLANSSSFFEKHFGSIDPTEN